MENSNIELNKKITNIEIKIDEINNKLNILLEKIDDDLVKECKKMGSHIDFVENIYDKVKKPLNYVCDKFNNLKINDNTKYLLENNQNQIINNIDSDINNDTYIDNKSDNENNTDNEYYDW